MTIASQILTVTEEPPVSADSFDSICARIASWAAAAPGRPAVLDGAVRLTHGELDRLSDELAALLLDAGAGPESCVGLFFERSTEFVVAALAVLKTGAAYLPLDPATPADRAAFILTDAGAPLLLTHRRKANGIPPGPWQIIDVDALGVAASVVGGADEPRPSGSRALASDALADARGSSGPIDSPSDSLAYIIYTSGSTGRPKGVEITHANLLNLVDWHQEAFRVTSADRTSLVAGLGFDAAGWEIWPALAAGASLHIADELTRRSPHALRDWLVAEKITISFVPTVLAEQLLHAAWPAETALRTLLTGADALHRRPASGLPFVLVNNYGPTECTVVATSGTVAPDAAAGAPPTIGRPIANARAFILDEQLRPVPSGEPGELCLGGAIVGRGYRNLPELTASRFVMFVPDSGPALRIYRTGDRARMLAGGEIAFLGRLDDQVKIRGYRIELGEIVASLDRYPGVEANAVTLRDAAGTAGTDGDGAPPLVAYVVAAPGANFSASDLREFLAARLPDYMIPAQFVTVSGLPTTANGKLDKAALPPPSADNLLPYRTSTGPGTGALPAGPSATAGADAAPRPCAGMELEERIGSMVALLLGQPSIERDDDFFMLGGHSMLGAQLVARIGDTFGVKLTLRQLFGAPTVADLSVEVARLTKAGANQAAGWKVIE